MESRELERVLLYQRKDLENLKKKTLCHRLEEKLIDLYNNLSQVISTLHALYLSQLAGKSPIAWSSHLLDTSHIKLLDVGNLFPYLRCLIQAF